MGCTDVSERKPAGTWQRRPALRALGEWTLALQLDDAFDSDFGEELVVVADDEQTAGPGAEHVFELRRGE